MPDCITKKINVYKFNYRKQKQKTNCYQTMHVMPKQLFYLHQTTSPSLIMQRRQRRPMRRMS